MLSVLWRDPQPLDEAQVAYVSAVASMVAQALVRAQIYADENARAAVLLAAVLPTEPPEIAGLDVGIGYHPQTRCGLGGDWYDLIPIPETGATYLAVGDVVGHGLSSVEDVAQLRGAARALAFQGLSPGRMVTELNSFARHATKGGCHRRHRRVRSGHPGRTYAHRTSAGPASTTSHRRGSSGSLNRARLARAIGRF